MKIRNGFVSNSSSSSFIIGYGVIKDREQLESYLRENKIELNYEVKILDHNYLFECPKDKYWSEDILCGGNDTDLKIPEEYYTEELFVVEIHNNEGDSYFNQSDYDWDPDYDKARDPSFYSEQQQKIIKLFDNEEFFSKSYYIIGAERYG